MKSLPLTSLGYLKRLLRFALREHPVVLANLGLASLSVLFDLAAIASVMPLSIIASGGHIGPDSKWARAFAAVGVDLTFTALLSYLLFLFALRLITNFINQTTSIYLGKRVQAHLSSRAFSRLVNETSLREVDRRSIGHFISLAGDETARAGAIMITINQLLAAALLSAAYLGAIFYFSRTLGLAVIAFLAVAVLSLRGTLRRSQALSALQLEQAKMAHSVFLDALNGLRSVRALSAESFVTSKYDEIIRRYTRTHFRIDTLGFAARLVPALIVLVCVAMAVRAGYMNVGGPSALAAVVTGLAFLVRFFPATGQVLSLVMRLFADVKGASDVTHLLDSDHADAPAPRRERLGGRIERLDLCGVSFSHKANRPVLRDFNATFERGHSYALVGASGSGKTTIFDLMLGFYSPDAGEVLVNGVRVQEIDIRSLRSHVVLVGQQVAILNDTIANNVRYGKHASQAEVERACANACIDEYVRALPQGYETLLSYQGGNLSGGQRQRIAIARALLRHPDVLLLDESTAGLDGETRDRIIRNIADLYADRIVVYATHDRDVVSSVDVVASLPKMEPDADDASDASEGSARLSESRVQ